MRRASDFALAMITSLLRSCLGVGLAITACAPAVLAQGTTTAGGANAVSDSTLRQQFREGFSKGCLAGKTPGVTNQAGFCACMAAAYTKRYSGRMLAVISQLAGGAGQVGPQLVDAMMAPERLSCVSKASAGER